LKDLSRISKDVDH